MIEDVALARGQMSSRGSYQGTALAVPQKARTETRRDEGATGSQLKGFAVFVARADRRHIALRLRVMYYGGLPRTLLQT